MELLEVPVHEHKAQLGVLRGELRGKASDYRVAGGQGRLDLLSVPEPQLGQSPAVQLDRLPHQLLALHMWQPQS